MIWWIRYLIDYILFSTQQQQQVDLLYIIYDHIMLRRQNYNN